MEQNTDKNKLDFTGFMYLFFVGLFLWLWHSLQGKKKEPYTTTRKILAKQYDVDLKTFNKWVQLLADPTILSYATFTKQRGLTKQQYDYLIQLLGSPTKEKTKYSKFDIVASGDEGIGHNDYRDVRQSIKKYPDKCIISPEIYNQLNVFPPRIGRKLKQQMG